ncbi:UDP-glucose 4-epimerase domain protein [Glaesserella parasuis H465]|nr:UDP-glucose 4-epimerase domain protein [Glaesserella parasuis H465]
MVERILEDTVKANPQFSAAVLRYFNPVGAHPSDLKSVGKVRLEN